MLNLLSKLFSLIGALLDYFKGKQQREHEIADAVKATDKINEDLANAKTPPLSDSDPMGIDAWNKHK